MMSSSMVVVFSCDGIVDCGLHICWIVGLPSVVAPLRFPYLTQGARQMEARLVPDAKKKGIFVIYWENRLNPPTGRFQFVLIFIEFTK